MVDSAEELDPFDDIDFDDSDMARLDAVEVERAATKVAIPIRENRQASNQANASSSPSSSSSSPARAARGVSTLFDGDSQRRIICPETPQSAKSVPIVAEQSSGPGSPRSLSGLDHRKQVASDLLDADDEWDDAILSELENAYKKCSSHQASGLRPAQGAEAGSNMVSSSSHRAQEADRGVGSSRTAQRTVSGGFVQRNLFGEVASQCSGPGILTMSSQGRRDAQSSNGIKRACRTQQWNSKLHCSVQNRRFSRSRSDHFGAAQSSIQLEGEIIDDVAEYDEAEQATSVGPVLPPDPMRLQLNVEAAKKFIYPINMNRRDYQYNIVQKALYDNVLVALPTGLGKTFIAAVVILNFFHWYPQGKIIFVAPSKPLVAQQQVACHGICGLPWDVACEMTGENPGPQRSEDWDTKRIFYMTPQTLQNDIANERVDPKDIVCLVVDEAHRATGNYAYCSIVAQIQALNPYFRILALTATPGTTSQRVQEVIDNLHISLIELRTEEALDIRQYIHKKKEDPIVVTLHEDLEHVRELYLAVMEENCDSLVKHGLLPRADPARLHDYQVRSLFRQRSDILSKKRWLGGMLVETASMAEARKHLDVYSLRMFRTRVQSLLDGMKKQDAKKAKLAQVLNLAASIPDESHPKMVKAVDTLLEHFRKETAAGNDTRVMVFCSLREAVRELCDLLDQHEGLRATPFIGQASDKNGKGLTQKQQKDVVERFKRGEYNILVATSIGEEGLDIGEIDLILCYEAPKNSIRMLQRIGRTGRKREGRIVILLSEYESGNWQESKDNYKGVQHLITVGNNVTLYDDVPRLVPPSIRPVAHFEHLDRPEFRPELIGSKKNAKSDKTDPRPKKRRARLVDPTRNVPEGALMGFLRASALREGDDEDPPEILRGTTVRRGSGANGKSEGSSDDSDDEALERGILFDREGLDISMSRGSLSNADGKREQQTTYDGPEVEHNVIASNFNEAAPEDTYRRSIDSGLPPQRPSKRLAVDAEIERSTPLQRQRTQAVLHSGQKESLTASGKGKLDAPKRRSRPSVPAHSDSYEEYDASFSLDGDAMAYLSQQALRTASNKMASSNEEAKSSEGVFAGAQGGNRFVDQPVRRGGVHPLIADLAASEGLTLQAEGSRSKGMGPMRAQGFNEDGILRQAPAKAQRSEDTIVLADTPPIETRDGHLEPSNDTEDSPVVMHKRRARRTVAALPSSSPIEVLQAMGPPKSRPVSSRRLQSGSRIQEEFPEQTTMSRTGIDEAIDGSNTDVQQASRKRSKQKRKRIGNSPTSRAFFQTEADRDTDEELRDVNRSDSDDEGMDTDLADSSDLEHVGEFEATQAPKGYNQHAIYQQSLLTQMAPTPFRRKVVGGFVGGRYGRRESSGEEEGTSAHESRDITRGRPGRRAAMVSSSIRGHDDDDYSLDSFVCDDDDVEYASNDGSVANDDSQN